MFRVLLFISVSFLLTNSLFAEPSKPAAPLTYALRLSLNDPPAIFVDITSTLPVDESAEPQLAWTLTVAGLETSGEAKLIKSADKPNHWTIQQPLVAQQSPQTTRVTGTVTLHAGAQVAELAIDQTLLPSINHWIVAGPFEYVQAPAMTNKFRQMRTPKLDVKLPNGYDRAPAAWHTVSRSITPETDLSSEFVLDLNRIFGDKEHARAMAFAWATIEAPEFTYAALSVGSNDGVTVWLNNKEVLRKIVKRDYRSGEDHVLIKLEQGANVMLVRIGNRDGAWQLGVHLQDRDGRPLLNAKIGQ